MTAVQPAMRGMASSIALAAVLLGCTHDGTTKPPPFAKHILNAPPTSPPAVTPCSPSPLRATWALTRPALKGTVHVAAAPGSIYVAVCGEFDVRVMRIDERGRLVWSTQILGPCAEIFGNPVQPLAASDDGIVVAVPATVGGAGVRMLFLDSAGDIAWDS